MASSANGVRLLLKAASQLGKIPLHPSHLSLGEALEWIDRVKPKRAVLTHMHIDLDYETLCRDLPPNVVPAYDGMVLEFNDIGRCS